MKPNPLSSLNHLTVPVAIAFPPAFDSAANAEIAKQGYGRWHFDIGRITRPELATVSASAMSARQAPVALACSQHRPMRKRDLSQQTCSLARPPSLDSARR